MLKITLSLHIKSSEHIINMLKIYNPIQSRMNKCEVREKQTRRRKRCVISVSADKVTNNFLQEGATIVFRNYRDKLRKTVLFR